MNENNTLSHYGVKGMRWGVVRKKESAPKVKVAKISPDNNKFASDVEKALTSQGVKLHGSLSVNRIQVNGGGYAYSLRDEKNYYYLNSSGEILDSHKLEKKEPRDWIHEESYEEYIAKNGSVIQKGRAKVLALLSGKPSGKKASPLGALKGKTRVRATLRGFGK